MGEEVELGCGLIARVVTLPVNEDRVSLLRAEEEDGSVEAEEAVSSEVLPGSPPLAHPPVELLFVGAELNRYHIPVLPIGEGEEDVDGPPIAPGAPVVQFLNY